MANYTVLIVDYDPRSIDSLRSLLTGQGHRVEVAKDGLHAMQAFERHRPDMVILEAMIPKKHGFEVCQEIKARPEGKDIPVIIMTAVYRGRKYRTQAFHMYHCDEYLEKPVPDERLLGTVKELLHGKTPRSDETSHVGTALEDIAPDVGARPDVPPQAPVEAKPKPVEAKPAPKPAAKPAPKPAAVAPEPQAAAEDDPGDSFADVTEDDILSRLDEIMPDDDSKPAKTAGS